MLTPLLRFFCEKARLILFCALGTAPSCVLNLLYNVGRGSLFHYKKKEMKFSSLFAVSAASLMEGANQTNDRKFMNKPSFLHEATPSWWSSKTPSERLDVIVSNFCTNFLTIYFSVCKSRRACTNNTKFIVQKSSKTNSLTALKKLQIFYLIKIP